MLTELGLYKLWGEDPERTQVFARGFMAPIVRALSESYAYGVDRVPASGGIVIAANHFATVDPLFLGIFTRRSIYFMSKLELLEMPVLGEVLRWLGAFAVRRGEGDRDSLRVARWAAAEGHAVGFFMEGTRQHFGYPSPGHAGAAMVAIQEGVPVVPCGIDTFQWSIEQSPAVRARLGRTARSRRPGRNGRGYKEGARDRRRGDSRALAPGRAGGRRTLPRGARRRRGAERPDRQLRGRAHQWPVVAPRGLGEGAARPDLSRGGLMDVEPAVSLRGAAELPGDKSISHRALLVGAVSEGEVAINGFGRSLDTESSLAAIRALGADVDEGGETLAVLGVGLRGLREPAAPIDCGNAGTLARLLPGLLAGQSDRGFTLTGDASLSSRPMERIAAPLAEMGAGVTTTDGRLPMTVAGAALAGIEHEPLVASAQVKSCVLLAGLYASGPTTMVEPVPTRDHTERLLRSAGVRWRRGAAA